MQASAKTESSSFLATFSVAAYELRWACPHCSDNLDGKDLAPRDTFHCAPSTTSKRYEVPCDWCTEQGLDACSKEEHDKVRGRLAARRGMDVAGRPAG